MEPGLKTSRKLLACLGLAALSLLSSFVLLQIFAKQVYLPDPEPYFGDEMPEDVRAQLEHFYAIWDDPEAVSSAYAAMKAENPEWDLIGRSFLAYSLANVAIQYPGERSRALEHLDRIIDSTMAIPWRELMLAYGSARPFVEQPASSIMVDGERCLMIGLRRLVEDPPDYRWRDEHRRLAALCVERIERGPVMCAESYPDECWLFCTRLALTAVKVCDVLEGENHSELYTRWGVEARRSLIKPDVGLFYSAITLKGGEIQPPEGSTIWIGAQMLLPVCPELAREQYAAMKEKLSGRLLCFSFGREWPRGVDGNWGIDSGFTPFGMGPASTGFGLVAAKEMGDRDFFMRLLGLLDMVGVPQTEDGKLRYRSSNLVGDTIFLYGKTTGPAWRRIAGLDQ